MNGSESPAQRARATRLRRCAAVALGVTWVAASIGLRVLEHPSPALLETLRAVHAIEHVAIHLGLALWFGLTLRHGSVPLIARLALRVHGRLTPAKERYTRRVTQVWTAAFAAIALASVALHAARPYAEWALFADVASPLLLLALFFGEYALRYRLHPEFERTRVRDMVRAWTHVAATSDARGSSGR